MAENQAQYYDHMTLPGKGPVYFRDAQLRKGRDFSVSGDVESDKVKFDGSGNVNLVTRIGKGKVGLDNIAENAKGTDLDDDPGKLATVGLLKKAGSFVLVTARKRPDHYTLDTTYEQLLHYIETGIVPVLRVVDGRSSYRVGMSSFDDTTGVFTFRMEDEHRSSESAGRRDSSTIVREYKYSRMEFTLDTREVKPAAYSVETIDIGV